MSYIPAGIRHNFFHPHGNPAILASIPVGFLRFLFPYRSLLVKDNLSKTVTPSISNVVFRVEVGVNEVVGDVVCC